VHPTRRAVEGIGSSRHGLRQRRWTGALLLAGVLSLPMPAAAVILAVTDTGSTYGIALRVGSVAAVDTVTFNVTGNNVGLTPAPVVGTPTVDVWVTPVRPMSSSDTARPVTLRVDSAAGLPCQAGGCGSTIIPFTEISWTASNNGAASSGDIQSGRFAGTANQQIASFNANATYCSGIELFGLCILGSWMYQSNTMNATRLQFTYDNDVVYPAGTYRGIVRFTASME